MTNYIVAVIHAKIKFIDMNTHTHILLIPPEDVLMKSLKKFECDNSSSVLVLFMYIYIPGTDIHL